MEDSATSNVVTGELIRYLRHEIFLQFPISCFRCVDIEVCRLHGNVARMMFIEPVCLAPPFMHESGRLSGFLIV